MAGYLRQLAEQALRPGPTLRSSVVDTLLLEPAVTFDNIEPAQAAPSPPMTSQAAEQRPPYRRSTSPDGPVEHVSTEPGDTMDGPDGQRAAKSTVRREPASASVPSPAPSRSRPKNAPAQRHRGRTIERNPALPSLDVILEPAAFEDPSPRLGQPAEQARFRPLRPARMRSAVGDLPTKTRQAPSPATDRAPAPDVHVHIGRIELTAVAAPAAKRQPSSVSKPMTLDAYLRQRRQKSP